MIQSGGFLSRLLGPSLKTRLPLIKNVIKPLGKSVLIPLGLTAAASAADAGIHKKILRSGKHKQNKYTRTLIISNDEMKDIIEIVKPLEDFGLLLEGVIETIQNEAKEQKGEFLSMLLGTLGATLLGNILVGKGAIATSHGWGMNRVGERAIAMRQGRGIVGAGYGNKKTTTNNKTYF